MVTHLTHTGYYAGVPYCSVNKPEAMERGERFIHPPYASRDKWQIPDLCPDCVAVLDEAESETDDSI